MTSGQGLPAHTAAVDANQRNQTGVHPEYVFSEFVDMFCIWKLAGGLCSGSKNGRVALSCVVVGEYRVLVLLFHIFVVSVLTL